MYYDEQEEAEEKLLDPRHEANKPRALKARMVYQGLMYAEIARFLYLECREDGYGGCEVRQTITRYEIIIKAARAASILGERGRRIRELQSAVISRFGIDAELFVETLSNRMLSPAFQAESLMYKILHGLSYDRAANGVVRAIMESGAKGVEVILSGKLKGQRARAQVFKDGYQLISSGHEAKVHVVCGQSAARLRSGVVGIKVKILLPDDGKRIFKDVVKVLEPPTPKIHPPTFSYTGFQPLPPGWTPQANQTDKKKKKKKKTQAEPNGDSQKKDKQPKTKDPKPVPPSVDRPARGGRMPRGRGGRIPMSRGGRTAQMIQAPMF